MHLRNTLQHYRINQIIRYFSQMFSKSPHLVLLLSGLCFLVSVLLYWSIFVRQEKEGTGLHAFYYGNTAWEGDPWKAALLETEISSATENFREAEQHLNNQFSVAWKGYIFIPATGEYTFSTNSDDGSWVFIDDTLVVDNGGPHGLQEVQGTTYLEKGLHKIQIKYFQIGGASRLEVFWAKGTEPKRTLTSKVLFPSDARIACLWYRAIQKVLLTLMIIPALMLLIIEKQIGLQEQISTKKQPNALVLLVICILIPIWQSTFALSASKLDSSYRMTASRGLYNMDRYLYFYYYLNLFPLALSGDVPLIYNKEGAEMIARENPTSLRMDIDHNIRGGSSGRIWLFLPAAFLNGEPTEFSLVWINASLFSLALIAFIIAAWWQDKLIFGIFVVALIGSHPFQLYEIYGTPNRDAPGALGNIFALTITITVFLLALHLAIIFDRKIGAIYLWTLPTITGIIMGLALHIRPEFMPIMASVALCYITARNFTLKKKAGLLLVLVGVFGIVTQAGTMYFERKFDQTIQFLNDVGGFPYEGIKTPYHNFWHPLFVGLGDFGQERGFAWNDHVGFDYAYPILKARLGDDFDKYFGEDKRIIFQITKETLQNLQESGLSEESSNSLKPLKMRRFGDKDAFLDAVAQHIGRRLTDTYQELILRYAQQEVQLYTQPLWLLPEFNAIVKERILNDVKSDPFWFLNILKKRAVRIFLDVTPGRLGIGAHWLSLPVSSFIFIPTILVFIFLRHWGYVKLLCFSLPVALPALIIYSGGGMTYYSIFLQIMLAIYGVVLWGELIWIVNVLKV